MSTKRIKARRHELSMTQADLARKAGVSQPLIAKWESESGVRPSEKSIFALADALNTTVEWLSDGNHIEASLAKQSRSKIITVRLEPRMKYLAEIASRSHRRSLSSFVEWAVEAAILSIVICKKSNRSIADVAADLWDVDESDRFQKLASAYPELLTYDEQVRWKSFQNCGIDNGKLSMQEGEKL